MLAGLILASAGMALFPSSARFGIVGLILAIVLLYTGINLQRSPLHALIVDLVPSRHRSLATGSFTFQMCVGAIVFLMLGRMLGMHTAFLIASARVLAIAAAFAVALREPATAGSQAAEATFQSLADAAWSALRGDAPAVRAVFIASLLLQLTFQTFSTWYALHGTERFGVRPEDVTTGFIAWAVGGVIGAIPAGVIGVRFGRRNAMLLGFALMAGCLIALDRVHRIDQAVPLLALASASWTLPTVNAYPLFAEPIPPERRGVLAALFLSRWQRGCNWRPAERRPFRCLRKLSSTVRDDGGVHRVGPGNGSLHTARRGRSVNRYRWARKNDTASPAPC